MDELDVGQENAMPVNTEDLRLVALSLPGVEEGLSHGTLAFYVRRKLLARLQEDGDSISIGCLREDRDDLIERFPDIFFLTEHFRAYDYILLNLTSANLDLLRKIFESAWRRRASKREISQFDSTRNQKPNRVPENS